MKFSTFVKYFKIIMLKQFNKNNLIALLAIFFLLIFTNGSFFILCDDTNFLVNSIRYLGDATYESLIYTFWIGGGYAVANAGYNAEYIVPLIISKVFVVSWADRINGILCGFQKGGLQEYLIETKKNYSPLYKDAASLGYNYGILPLYNNVYCPLLTYTGIKPVEKIIYRDNTVIQYMDRSVESIKFVAALPESCVRDIKSNLLSTNRRLDIVSEKLDTINGHFEALKQIFLHENKLLNITFLKDILAFKTYRFRLFKEENDFGHIHNVRVQCNSESSISFNPNVIYLTGDPDRVDPLIYFTHINDYIFLKIQDTRTGLYTYVESTRFIEESDGYALFHYLKSKDELSETIVPVSLNKVGRNYQVEGLLQQDFLALQQITSQIENEASTLLSGITQNATSYLTIMSVASMCILPWAELSQNLNFMNETFILFQKPEVLQALVTTLQSNGQVIPEFLQQYANQPATLPNPQDYLLPGESILSPESSIGSSIDNVPSKPNYLLKFGAIMLTGAFIAGGYYLYKNGFDTTPLVETAKTFKETLQDKYVSGLKK